MITCCGGCQKRSSDCHGKCEEYDEQLAIHNAEKEAEREQRRKSYVLHCRYVKESKDKLAHKKHRRTWR